MKNLIELSKVINPRVATIVDDERYACYNTVTHRVVINKSEDGTTRFRVYAIMRGDEAPKTNTDYRHSISCTTYDLFPSGFEFEVSRRWNFYTSDSKFEEAIKRISKLTNI